MRQHLWRTAALAISVGLLALAAVAAVPASAAKHHAAHLRPAHHAVRHGTETVGPDTDSVESGSTATPDPSATQVGSANGEEPGSEDGAGGHEDQPEAGAEHEFEGTE
jgi:hypothetical protein